MMKTLIVNLLQLSSITAQDVPASLDQAHIPFQAIDEVNWSAEYPYAPSVQFRMAYMEDKILIHYMVEEQSVRAVAEKDNGSVWQDSCCEFFVSPTDDGTYYNIEANCAGQILLANGAGRHDRTFADPTVISQIDRWSSLGRTPFEEKIGNCAWEMALVIPTTVFFKHNRVQLKGQKMRANFYKCGDLLQTPHFLSWNKIDVPTPDFHRPEFFGMIEFR